VLFNELQDLFAAESAHGVSPGAQTDIGKEGLSPGRVVLDPGDIDAEHLSDLMGIHEVIGMRIGVRWDQLKSGFGQGRGPSVAAELTACVMLFLQA
jgi:hypothetical protein